MSSTDALNEQAPSEDHLEAERSEFWKTLESVLAPLASLKLTVFLFLLSIFIVLAGTLAQVEADIWEVIGEYFRVNMTISYLNPQSGLTHVSNGVIWGPVG